MRGDAQIAILVWLLLGMTCIVFIMAAEFIAYFIIALGVVACILIITVDNFMQWLRRKL